MRRMLTEKEIKAIGGGGGGEVTPEILLRNMQGSDTVVVDLNEAGTKVAFKLDQDVIDDIDDALTRVDQAETDLVNLSGAVNDLESEVNGKQDTLTAGQNITIVDNVISATGGGGEPDAYIKSASVSENTLTLTDQDDATVSFTPDPYTFNNGLTKSGTTVSSELYDRIRRPSPNGTINIGSVSTNVLTGTETNRVAIGSEVTVTGGAKAVGIGNSISIGRGYIYAMGHDLSIPASTSFTTGSVVLGNCNEEPTTGESCKFAVGIGSSSSDTKNGLEIYNDGDVLVPHGDIIANNIPTAPTSDGNYVLKCSVVDGVATYSWESLTSAESEDF